MKNIYKNLTFEIGYVKIETWMSQRKSRGWGLNLRESNDATVDLRVRKAEKGRECSFGFVARVRKWNVKKKR